MRFTTKAEYGLAALADIALHSEQEHKTTTAKIAQRQHISQKYLEQILIRLRQANIIRAEKGQKGGYSLTREASGIRITDVLNALDSSILADAAEVDTDSDIRVNVKSFLWDRMNGMMRNYTDQLTLADLIEECGSGDENWMYMI